MKKIFSIKAFAKINLLLDVLDEREDNYHNILTIFQSIDLFDIINIERSKTFGISVSDKNIPINELNTIVKAYNIFKEAYKSKGKWTHFNIKLEKKIPMGSGLGGGSADGAAMLRFLNHFYKNPFNKKELQNMAYQVGADVVFLLRGGSAIGRGRGEKLKYFYNKELEDLNVVIVYPNIHISTKWAYQNVKKYLTKQGNSYNILNSKNNYNNFIGSLKISYNVFENLVYEYYPRIKEIKEKLEDFEPILSMMTGSGSALFAIFQQNIDTSKIERLLNGNTVFFTRLLTDETINKNFLTTM